MVMKKVIVLGLLALAVGYIAGHVTKYPTEYDVAKYCQKLATTPNKNWSYASCHSEMRASLGWRPLAY